MKGLRSTALAFAILLLNPLVSRAASSLPGFQLRALGTTSGFLTSLAVDSKGTVYYTAQGGTIFRFADGQSTPAATVASSLGISDAGLLGMSLIDDNTAAVHYTVPPPSNPELVLYDIVSTINLKSGAETILKKFACDIEVPERGVSMLHHGGNPVSAPDGSFFVGLGEYGGRVLAQYPNWNGGKIWRVYPDKTVEQYALGLRNPFDFVWDEAKQRLIVPDNGDEGTDELHIMSKGANGGYPISSSNQPHLPWMSAPVYVWEPTISPCGTISLSGANNQLRSGILIVGYVSKGVHYIPDIDARPMPDPLIVLDATEANAEFVDVAEAPDGTFYLADGFKIYQMITPQRGDCNGDGSINSADINALKLELGDGPQARMNAQNGAHVGSWGCDVNGDDRIDAADMSALTGALGRRRGVGVRR